MQRCMKINAAMTLAAFIQSPYTKLRPRPDFGVFALPFGPIAGSNSVRGEDDKAAIIVSIFSNFSNILGRQRRGGEFIPNQGPNMLARLIMTTIGKAFGCPHCPRR